MVIFKQYLNCFRLLILLMLWVSHATSMAFDETHTEDDYINLSFEDPAFDAACAVIDSARRGAMTGVLVRPRVVMTAAHGVDFLFTQKDGTPSPILQEKNGFFYIPVDSMYVKFRSKENDKADTDDTVVQKIKVIAILVDARYFKGALTTSRTYIFDFAYLVLDGTPEGISPCKMESSVYVPNQTLLTVVSYGNSDRFEGRLDQALRRAFRLYERDAYYGNDNQSIEGLSYKSRHLQESSLFFKPSQLTKKPDPLDDEVIIRSYDATQNWIQDHKKPYALALPGTSGSPVFASVSDVNPISGAPIKRTFLLGLISSFAHISGQFRYQTSTQEIDYILDTNHEALNQYQTIFSLPYTKTKDNLYTIDPIVQQFIEVAEQIANQTPSVLYQKPHPLHWLYTILHFLKRWLNLEI